MKHFAKTWMFGLTAAACLSLVGCNGNSVNNAVSNAGQSVSNTASDVAGVVRNTTNTVRNGTTNVVRSTTNTVRNTTGNIVKSAHGVGLANVNHANLNSALGNKIVAKHLANQAYVYTVNKRAFIAVELGANNTSGLSNARKNAITSLVKKSDKNLNSVYVTARPDVFQRFKSYFQEAKAGKPATDWWSSFKTTINTTFPKIKTERY